MPRHLHGIRRHISCVLDGRRNVAVILGYAQIFWVEMRDWTHKPFIDRTDDKSRYEIIVYFQYIVSRDWSCVIGGIDNCCLCGQKLLLLDAKRYNKAAYYHSEATR